MVEAAAECRPRAARPDAPAEPARSAARSTTCRRQARSRPMVHALRAGQGCRIWDTRPEQCRAFNCPVADAGMARSEWKPETARMVFTMDPNTLSRVFQVDPGAPTAWKRESLLPIRNWAAGAAQENQHVLVLVNKHATLVLADRQVRPRRDGSAGQVLRRPHGTAVYQVRVARPSSIAGDDLALAA